MIKASVIGWPITHSRSPLIHGHWLKLHGIVGQYDKIAVAPDNLAAFFHSLRSGDHTGTNVTIPHKEAACQFVDEPDDRVRRIGALNTVWRDAGRLHATSTDGPGFLANLKATAPRNDVTHAPATVLGAGGSARAIVDELLRQHVGRIYIHNRTPERALALAHHFGPRVMAVDDAGLPAALRETGLLINTTSAALTGSGSVPMSWPDLNPKATVADIVYTPLITSFLQTAASRGHTIVPGLGMLLHQAVTGFEKWFGVRPEVTQALHDLVARDIDPDYCT
jgi:shikimate dehydrogenase